MRDQTWLEQQLAEIWRLHFPDIQERNPVRIMFGRRAYRRLGSISTDPQDREQTIIRVTGWFQYPQIPVEIVRSVIVHEMCHYAHGFHSGGAQQHTYPHAGGVIRREFAERDLEELYDRQQEWLRQEWPKFLRKHYKGNYIKNPNKKGKKQ